MVFVSVFNCSKSNAVRSFMSNVLQNTHGRSMGTATTRIIVVRDLPNGRAYAGDVTEVKAGYARNFLIPYKFALYATKQNFIKTKIKDPSEESPEERRARLQREAQVGQDAEAKAADILRHYLRSKTLTIKRNVQRGSYKTSPGMVDSKAIRDKLSKQLKIDLEPHEKVHLCPDLYTSFNKLTEDDIESITAKIGDVEKPCEVQVREIGCYLARISLSGGHSVPLKVDVIRR